MLMSAISLSFPAPKQEKSPYGVAFFEKDSLGNMNFRIVMFRSDQGFFIMVLSDSSKTIRVSECYADQRGSFDLIRAHAIKRDSCEADLLDWVHRVRDEPEDFSTLSVCHTGFTLQL